MDLAIATLGSTLDAQLSWKSSKFQLARWSLREAGLCREPHPPTHPPPNLLYSTLSLGCPGGVWGMSRRCYKMSGRCVEGVWISLEYVCNIPECVWKVSEWFPNIFPFNVVLCPHPNCSPSTKYVLYAPHPVFVFSPLFPPSRKYVGCPPSQYTFFPCGVPPLHVVLCLCHTWLSLGF